MAVKAIMEYIDASDCNMEEGSLRMDANISVRPRGEKKLRSKIEIKNMNSFGNLQLAIEAEIKRQIAAYSLRPLDDPSTVIQSGTYRFDLEKQETIIMRQKEEAHDYRYFPEPDLVPLVLSEEDIDAIRRALPELPAQRMKRYLTELGLPPATASTLINDKPLCDLFEEASRLCKQSKNLANWLIVEFTGRLKEKGLVLVQSGIPSSHLATLVNLIEEGTITGKIAKKIADEMVAHPQKDPREIIKESPDYQPVSDSASIEPIVDQVLRDNPQSIADFKAGKGRAFDFLVGQVMKLTKGKAAPSIVNDLLAQKLK
jgi:aspartyl-tRNA(Asn)/glutamyl-tRNA(Gln) amidotransferase subunit B